MSKLKGLKNRLDYKLFDLSVKSISRKPPVNLDLPVKGLCVLSMICARDFYQYLCSIYSFCELLKPEKIVVVNDGSLKNWHKDVLKTKVPGIEILWHEDYVDNSLPTYTSWRRLLAIEALNEHYYVIQLDADIICKHNLDEVRALVEKELPFILATHMGRVIPSEDARKDALDRNMSGDKHVQQASEENLDVLSDIGIDKYYRGCAGFAGFPKGSINREFLRKISERMYQRIGSKWNQWGSEQTCVNIMMPNFSGFEPLPIQYYDSVVTHSEKLKLIHFIGSYRFNQGIYRREARNLIQRLR